MVRQGAVESAVEEEEKENQEQPGHMSESNENGLTR
jgi:hypothetical protein